MHPTLATVTETYKQGSGLMPFVLKDLDTSHEFIRPRERTNSLNWIVGHIVATRYILAEYIGLSDKIDWRDTYTRGSDVKSKDEYPQMAELLKAWSEICPKIQARLAELTPEELEGDPPFEPPGWEQNLRGVINFLSFHEAYHLGQIVFVKRLLGYDQVFG